VNKKNIGRKSKGQGRMPGGSSLALSNFLDSAFSRIENLASSSTTARRKMRIDLQYHFGEIFARLKKLASQKKNSLAARWGRQQLAAQAVTYTRYLRETAMREQQDTAQRQCAGYALARIYVDLEKHDAAVARKNSAYRNSERTLRKKRKDVIVARSIKAKIVQEELARAEQYWQELQRCRLAGRKWRFLAGQSSIPKDYCCARRKISLTPRDRN
jgi:hypothetical protein